MDHHIEDLTRFIEENIFPIGDKFGEEAELAALDMLGEAIVQHGVDIGALLPGSKWEDDDDIPLEGLIG